MVRFRVVDRCLSRGLLVAYSIAPITFFFALNLATVDVPMHVYRFYLLPYAVLAKPKSRSSRGLDIEISSGLIAKYIRHVHTDYMM